MVLLMQLAALVSCPGAVVSCGCGHDPSRLSVGAAAHRGAAIPCCRAHTQRGSCSWPGLLEHKISTLLFDKYVKVIVEADALGGIHPFR